MDEDTLKELESRRTVARAMGGAAALAKLKAAGKLDARERIEQLLDPGSFREIGLLARSQHGALKARTPADGLVAGWGTIDGREVYVALRGRFGERRNTWPRGGGEEPARA